MTTETDALSGTEPAKPRSVERHGSAPMISVFATVGGERLHERFATRKAAADGIRYARSKGGCDINVFDPFTKMREAQNSTLGQT